MPNLPYPSAAALESPELQALVASIRQRRGGALLNIDRMLLHSLPLAQGWGALLGKVRNELSLPERLRELAICAVAALCGADYEIRQHGPLWLKAGGTPAQLDMLRDPEAIDERGFEPLERAVLRLARQMTLDVQVAPPLLDELRAALGERALVELVGVIASYNLVARFIVALGVEPEVDPR